MWRLGGREVWTKPWRTSRLWLQRPAYRGSIRRLCVWCKSLVRSLHSGPKAHPVTLFPGALPQAGGVWHIVFGVKQALGLDLFLRLSHEATSISGWEVSGQDLQVEVGALLWRALEGRKQDTVVMMIVDSVGGQGRGATLPPLWSRPELPVVLPALFADLSTSKDLVCKKWLSIG